MYCLCNIITLCGARFFSNFLLACVLDLHGCVYVVVGIWTDEPTLFANSWAVDLPHMRACPSVEPDFNGPCQSESDMDVRTEIFCFLTIASTIYTLSYK